MNSLKEGDIAPDFSAQSTSGKEVKLSSLKGKNVVLYFYPKDDTPGCTIEAKEFTESVSQFSNKDTIVFGVSFDDIKCHQAFIDKYKLKIELLADTNGSIAKAYNSAGTGYAQRNTFLIGKDGKIQKIYLGVKPQGHAAEILKELK
jgi:peroxiredoxin Q/BCP